MAIDDPKKRVQAKDDDDETDDLREQIAALNATVQALVASKSAAGGLSEDALEKLLLRVSQVSAEAHERAANPSNKTHPAISVFSRPKGDRADRRDDFKCPMFWLGYPLDWDTTTDDEINLLNKAEPGLYTFVRTDGRTPETLTIHAERDPGGTISKLMFSFPTKENRESLPSLTNMLRSAFKVKSPREIELETLRSQVEALRASATVAAR